MKKLKYFKVFESKEEIYKEIFENSSFYNEIDWREAKKIEDEDDVRKVSKINERNFKKLQSEYPDVVFTTHFDLLYKAQNSDYIIRIKEHDDEYFLVEVTILNTNNPRYYNPRPNYKCDQFEGVIQLIKDTLDNKI